MVTRLHLIRGLPGSGKSTFAKTMIDAERAIGKEWVYYEADMWVPKTVDNPYTYDKLDAWKYHANCQYETYHALTRGQNVIVANTFCQYWEMIPYFDIAQKTRSRVSIHICRGQYESIHNVPAEVLTLMKERWEE